MSANHATSAQGPICLDYFCRIEVSNDPMLMPGRLHPVGKGASLTQNAEEDFGSWLVSSPAPALLAVVGAVANCIGRLRWNSHVGNDEAG